MMNIPAMRSQMGAALVAIACSACSLSAQERILVLDGGTLIDGTGRHALANAVVVVEGPRIKAVGRRG